MNRLVSLFVLSVMLLAAGNASAEQKYVVVNIQKIMQQATAAAAARDQLKAKKNQFQEEATKQESALQKEDQELAKQRTVLSQEAFQEKVTAFRQKAAGVQRDVQEKSAKLTKAFNSSILTIQKSVTDIITAMSREKGFDVAMPASQVLYYDPSLDVTDEVLARLNKQLPTMKVQF
ncbi:MAG: OmpH family outer membrane protein [Rickettsiales bacterium]